MTHMFCSHLDRDTPYINRLYLASRVETNALIIIKKTKNSTFKLGQKTFICSAELSHLAGVPGTTVSIRGRVDF